MEFYKRFQNGKCGLDFFGLAMTLCPHWLYDYEIEELKVQPIYNLSEPEVLRLRYWSI